MKSLDVMFKDAVFKQITFNLTQKLHIEKYLLYQFEIDTFNLKFHKINAFSAIKISQIKPILNHSLNEHVSYNNKCLLNVNENAQQDKH